MRLASCTLWECRDQVTITEQTGLLLAILAVALVGALVGTAGYAATIGRRQMRRILELTDRLPRGVQSIREGWTLHHGSCGSEIELGHRP